MDNQATNPAVTSAPAAPQAAPAQPTPVVNTPHSPKKSRKMFVVFAVVLLLLTIPVAVFLSQQEQDVRQEASAPRERIQQRNIPGNQTNQEPEAMRNASDEDAVMMYLDEEDREETTADTEEDTDVTVETTLLQEAETLGNTEAETE